MRSATRSGRAAGCRTGPRSPPSCRRSSRRYLDVRERELALVAVALAMASPAGSAARGGAGGDRRRRRAPRAGRPAADAAQLGIGPELEASIVVDARRGRGDREQPADPVGRRNRGDPGRRPRLAQRRMKPGRSGSLPCQRSYSSVWKRANRLMKWAPCSRKISTARFVCAAPRARTEMTNRPSRAAAS